MNNTFLFLTGGLGNQLFQFSAGLSRGGTPLVLDWTLGSPRLNSAGFPDITDFEIPDHVQWSTGLRKNKFFSKFSGYLLRRGLQPGENRTLPYLTRLLTVILGKLLYLRYTHCVKVVQARDNGYFTMTDQTDDEYLIGYFQSYLWPNSPKVAPHLESLRLIEPSNELMSFIDEIQHFESVMIHVRLGDYLNQDNFGIPSIKYYDSALSEIKKFQKIEKILLFSNEPTLAFSYIPDQYQELIYTVPHFGGRSAETLEAMRYARSYIIGNSSLSWWGAKLTYNRGAKVIAPMPWFKSAAEPSELIPPEWLRKDGFHE